MHAIQIDCFEVASAGQYVTRNGNHSNMLKPYGIFGKNSGGMMIAALNPKLWGIVPSLMGRPELADDPMFIAVAERNKNQNELIPIIDYWVDSFGDLNELEELLMKTIFHVQGLE